MAYGLRFTETLLHSVLPHWIIWLRLTVVGGFQPIWLIFQRYGLRAVL